MGASQVFEHSGSPSHLCCLPSAKLRGFVINQGELEFPPQSFEPRRLLGLRSLNLALTLAPFGIEREPGHYCPGICARYSKRRAPLPLTMQDKRCLIKGRLSLFLLPHLRLRDSQRGCRGSPSLSIFWYNFVINSDAVSSFMLHRLTTTRAAPAYINPRVILTKPFAFATKPLTGLA